MTHRSLLRLSRTFSRFMMYKLMYKLAPNISHIFGFNRNKGRYIIHRFACDKVFFDKQPQMLPTVCFSMLYINLFTGSLHDDLTVLQFYFGKLFGTLLRTIFVSIIVFLRRKVFMR